MLGGTYSSVVFLVSRCTMTRLTLFSATYCLTFSLSSCPGGKAPEEVAAWKPLEMSAWASPFSNCTRYMSFGITPMMKSG